MVTTVSVPGDAPPPHIGMYGNIGSANTSPTIQAMVSDVGYFTLPVGTFLCQDPITIPPHATTLLSIDTVFSGMGPNKSVLQASGMAGEVLIKPLIPTGLYRFTMRDMGLIGDADSAFDFTLTDGGGNQLYKSLFENMHFQSIAGPAFKTRNEFTVTVLRCSFHSDGNHALHMGGGNTTLLINCYAHNCGNGFAGYRIEKHATLIECNGVDIPPGAVSYWGWFGKDTTGIYQIALVGGNAEDFRTAAIALEYDGQIDINNFSMLAPSSGTFETYIKLLSGNAHRIGVRGNTRVVSKGATRTGNSNISGTGCVPLVENYSNSTTGAFPDYYNTTASLLYNVPNLQVRGDGLGALALQITRSHALRETGYILPSNTAITANATTFVVTGLNSVRTANTGATLLSQLTGGEDYQELTLIIGDANTTVQHLVGGAGRFSLLSGANETPALGRVYRFVSYGSIWRQI